MVNGDCDPESELNGANQEQREEEEKKRGHTFHESTPRIINAYSNTAHSSTQCDILPLLWCSAASLSLSSSLSPRPSIAQSCSAECDCPSLQDAAQGQEEDGPQKTTRRERGMHV
jgi:hypothetical protein